MRSEAINRIEGWGRVDRDNEISFMFDGVLFKGYKGDTLASSLLSYDCHLVGRSFKYHRPRGIMGFGSEEPNALVSYGEGRDHTPNTRATVLEIYEGMISKSQNAWPNLHFDLGSINSLFSRFLPSGFYYKTFIAGWEYYEPFIRKMAGLGTPPLEECSNSYAWQYAHCDILIIGAGISGLGVLSEVIDSKASVIVVDENPCVGGWLLGDYVDIEQKDGAVWGRELCDEAIRHDNIRVLVRTTAVSLYQDNYVLAVERKDELASDLEPQEILWKIRAKEIILASGAVELPSVFAGNDKPAVMMSGAVRRYAKHYGVRVGTNIAVVTNNDDGYQTALTMKEVGSEVTVVDPRSDPRGRFADRARDQKINIITESFPCDAKGFHRVKRLGIKKRGQKDPNPDQELDCDVIAMSHGFTPSLHLYCHRGGKVQFDSSKEIFIPEHKDTGRMQVVGMAWGEEGMVRCLESGRDAARNALSRIGMKKRGRRSSIKVSAIGLNLSKKNDTELKREAFWFPSIGFKDRSQFVDFQNDVTLGDVVLAHQEGFVSVEHVKRYTTLGMATDQGKNSNIQGLMLLSMLRGQAPGEVGVTTYRPPYTPITFGSIVGLNRYDNFHPIRTTSAHSCHIDEGAVFEDVGDWKRPLYYNISGHLRGDSVSFESRTVREKVGMIDASTLGKIDIQGKDSVKLLEMLYTNSWRQLKPGYCRYGIMLDEAGMVLDDGVTTCLEENHYHMTTTTGGAARVMQWIESWLQTEWYDLEVFCTSVTDQWSVFSISGPLSREILQDIVEEDLSEKSFPYLSYKDCHIGDVPIRIFRISFTGEISFEINVPSRYGKWLWQLIHGVGKEHDMVLYGTDAMHLLRAEVGFIIVGQDTDATVNPYDADQSWIVKDEKQDFLGKRALSLSGMVAQGRRQLVGLESDDPLYVLEEGAVIVDSQRSSHSKPWNNIGHVTSSYMSPNLGRSIAMGLVKDGLKKEGQTVWVGKITDDKQELVPAKITSRQWLDNKNLEKRPEKKTKDPSKLELKNMLGESEMPLDYYVSVEGKDCSIAPKEFVGMIKVRANLDKITVDNNGRLIFGSIGCDWAIEPCTYSYGESGRRCIWNGPSEWTIICNHEEIDRIVSGLTAISKKIDIPLYWVEVSDQYQHISIDGVQSRYVLNSLISLNLDKRNFSEGCAAGTKCGRVNVTLSCLGGDLFELSVRRSEASYVWRLLESVVKSSRDFATIT